MYLPGKHVWHSCRPRERSSWLCPFVRLFWQWGQGHSINLCCTFWEQSHKEDMRRCCKIIPLITTLTIDDYVMFFVEKRKEAKREAKSKWVVAWQCKPGSCFLLFASLYRGPELFYEYSTPLSSRRLYLYKISRLFSIDQGVLVLLDAPTNTGMGSYLTSSSLSVS